MTLYDREEIITKMNDVQVTTILEFTHELRHRLVPKVNSGEFAILYGFLNRHKELIQNNRVKMNTFLNRVIERKQEFATKLQESETAPQWLKEMNMELLDSFTGFAQSLQERVMEIEG